MVYLSWKLPLESAAFSANVYLIWPKRWILKWLYLEAQCYPNQQSFDARIGLSRMIAESELDFEFRQWTIRLHHSRPRCPWMEVHLRPTSQIKSTSRKSSLASVRHELNIILTAKAKH
jgi:hypothetical protein